MAAGLPVLVSEQCGCAPDLVEHGRNGFVFDAHDENKLVEYMIRVASPSCERDIMGTRSKTIISRWTPDTFAQNLLKAADIACCHTVDSSASGFSMLEWCVCYSAYVLHKSNMRFPAMTCRT